MVDGWLTAGTAAESTGKLILFSTEAEFAEDKFSEDFGVEFEFVETGSALISFTKETVTKFSALSRRLPNKP